MNVLTRWTAHLLARGLALPPKPVPTEADAPLPEDGESDLDDLFNDPRYQAKVREDFLRLPRWQQEFVSEVLSTVRELEARPNPRSYARKEFRHGRD